MVGCGLDYSVGDDRADIFFTLNGESLPSNNNSSNDDGGGGGGGGGGGVGFAAFRGVKGTFYPTVGVDSACPVRINLGGEPFRFDLAGALRRGGQEAAAREVGFRLLLKNEAFGFLVLGVGDGDGDGEGEVYRRFLCVGVYGGGWVCSLGGGAGLERARRAVALAGALRSRKGLQ